MALRLLRKQCRRAIVSVGVNTDQLVIGIISRKPASRPADVRRNRLCCGPVRADSQASSAIPVREAHPQRTCPRLPARSPVSADDIGHTVANAGFFTCWEFAPCVMNENIPVGCVGADEPVAAISPPDNLAVISVLVVVV